MSKSQQPACKARCGLDTARCIPFNLEIERVQQRASQSDGLYSLIYQEAFAVRVGGSPFLVRCELRNSGVFHGFSMPLNQARKLRHADQKRTQCQSTTSCLHWLLVLPSPLQTPDTMPCIRTQDPSRSTSRSWRCVVAPDAQCSSFLFGHDTHQGGRTHLEHARFVSNSRWRAGSWI